MIATLLLGLLVLVLLLAGFAIVDSNGRSPLGWAVAIVAIVLIVWRLPS